MSYLKHQKFLPCPRMFTNSLCHAWRPLDVSDPRRSFDRQCGMGSDKIGVHRCSVKDDAVYFILQATWQEKRVPHFMAMNELHFLVFSFHFTMLKFSVGIRLIVKYVLYFPNSELKMHTCLNFLFTLLCFPLYCLPLNSTSTSTASIYRFKSGRFFYCI